jgi:hypothetical protein
VWESIWAATAQQMLMVLARPRLVIWDLDLDLDLGEPIRRMLMAARCRSSRNGSGSTLKMILSCGTGLKETLQRSSTLTL